MLHNIGPVPASHYSNTTYSLPSTVEWIFDSYELTCTLHPTIQRLYDSQYGSLPFLSANITVHDRTFSLDEFLQNFKIEFTPDNIPEPLHILRFWSITRSLWFTMSENPILNVIDNEGNEHSFSIFSNNDLDLWNSFFVVEEEQQQEEEVLEEEPPTTEQLDEQDLAEVVPEQPVPEPVVEVILEQPVPEVVSEQPVPVLEQPIAELPSPEESDQPPSLISRLELIEPTE